MARMEFHNLITDLVKTPRQLQSGTFFFVLQQFPGHSIDADFLRHCAAFNVEGISQATAAFFFFQFLVYDFAGMAFESHGPRLSDADFCTLREFLAGVRQASSVSHIVLFWSKQRLSQRMSQSFD